MLPQRTHSSNILILDPKQPRQLASNGSFVLWRRQHGRDLGLLGTTTSALDPKRHEVEVSCAVIDPYVVAVSVADARVLFPGGADDDTPPLEGPQADVTVDLARGRVTILAPDCGEIALWLGGALDGELLGHLHRAGAAAAGFDPDRPQAPRANASAYNADQFQYGRLFPRARPDGYVVEERTYVAADTYEGVLLPGAPRIAVSFIDERLRPMGTATLDLTDLRLVRNPESAATLTPAGGRSVLLAGLWRSYCQRHNVRPRLVARRGRLIAAIATGLLDSHAGSPKMTWNPCD